ncbi:MAG TPA: endolytic transglycosylase MltG, partial [Burkholderiales bacterium]|nr:endolytic transglycosylase MltG [Burkholderiales bacterium]
MRKWLKRVSLAALVGALIAAGWCVRYPYHHLPLKSSPMEFSINAGSTLRSATQQMVDAGILASPLPFEVLTRLFGDPKNIKAGNYEIEAGITPLRLMRKITRGDYTALAITFVEGSTFRQMRSMLDDHPALKHDTHGLKDVEVVEKLGLESRSPEGLFFPDTYHFVQGVSDLSILRRAYQLMDKHLTAQWQQRAPEVPL